MTFRRRQRAASGYSLQVRTASRMRPGVRSKIRSVDTSGTAETERGGCDPALGVVVTLAEGVPGPFAGSPQLGVGANEITARVDELCACDLRFQALQSRRAPPAEEGAIAELGDSLEREEGRSADEKGLVPLGEGGSGSEPGACRHRCRQRLGPEARSTPDGGEEGLGFLGGEIVDHRLAVGRQWPGTAEELLDRELVTLLGMGSGTGGSCETSSLPSRVPVLGKPSSVALATDRPQ